MSRIYNAPATTTKRTTTSSTNGFNRGYSVNNSFGTATSTSGANGEMMIRQNSAAAVSDPLRLIKADTNPLCVQAQETLTLLEQQNEWKSGKRRERSQGIDESSALGDWETSLSKWKNRRRSEPVYHPKVLDVAIDNINVDSPKPDSHHVSNSTSLNAKETYNGDGPYTSSATFDSIEPPLGTGLSEKPTSRASQRANGLQPKSASATTQQISIVTTAVNGHGVDKTVVPCHSKLANNTWRLCTTTRPVRQEQVDETTGQSQQRMIETDEEPRMNRERENTTIDANLEDSIGKISIGSEQVHVTSPCSLPKSEGSSEQSDNLQLSSPSHFACSFQTDDCPPPLPSVPPPSLSWNMFPSVNNVAGACSDDDVDASFGSPVNTTALTSDNPDSSEMSYF